MKHERPNRVLAADTRANVGRSVIRREARWASLCKAMYIENNGRAHVVYNI